MDVLTERSSRVVSLAKLHRAATRRREGRFLAEGANAVDAALTTGRAETVLVRQGESDRFADLIDRAGAAGVPVVEITARAADKLTETTTAPGVFAECELLTAGLGEVLAARPRQLAIAVEPREPGNVGTLIRCADAMGADAVLLLGDAVDPHNGKAVRASAGSLFHIPLAMETDVDAVITGLRSAGLRALAADAHGAVGLYDADARLAEPTAWLFGNEAHGLPDDLIARLDASVAIPIRGRAESLNLATAAAVCLYASAQAQS